jgi:hypothetical protein
MEEEGGRILVRVHIEVVDPFCVEGRSAPFNAMDNIPFLDQEFGEIASVLACDAGDERGFACGSPCRIARGNQCRNSSF